MGRTAADAPPPSLAPALAYGVFGLPLAFAALPIYVHVPKIYADEGGLSLAAVGAALLLARALDALTDPLIGWASDRLARRRLLLALSLPALALGWPALLAPPPDGGLGWMMGMLLVVTLGHSLASINYHAWGAELGRDASQRARVVAAREAFGLVGVLLAALLPVLLAPSAGWASLSAVWWPLLAGCGLITLMAAPRARPAQPAALSPWRGVTGIFAHPGVWRLLAVHAVNGLAAAIPSVTVLFYIADVLQAESRAGYFLALYFGAGALGLPLWVALARRFGAHRSWAAAMVLAVLAFVWASGLGAGELAAFSVVCLISGLALGADLALPPVMLANMLAGQGSEARGGVWFGWWSLIGKTMLAFAAGLALPLLGLLGYVPDAPSGEGLRGLALVYGLLPVLFKVLALMLLLRWRGHLEETPQ